jgi:hypothetical protein
VDVLWVTLALLVSGFLGWPVTSLVFRLARTIDERADTGSGGSSASAEHTAPAGDPSSAVTVDGEINVPAAPLEKAPSIRILRGGAIIGILERLAVCLTILGGQPEAIAFVVAIKGLGRFAELKATPVAAERFIIGTLTSMFWAAGIAALAKILFLD